MAEPSTREKQQSHRNESGFSKPSSSVTHREKLQSSARMKSVHWLFVALSLVLTFTAWYISKEQVYNAAAERFSVEQKLTIERVHERMQLYENVLRGGAAFIDTLDERITYQQWKDYADGLEIDRVYPGINGIGVIFNIQPDELDSYLELEKGWRPDYGIHPAHSQPEYWPITYIEPAQPNVKAIGLDMAFETNRYTAVKKARDIGLAQATGPITLVQDADETPGFLLYVPFYKDGQQPLSVDARRENIVGVVYAPFITRNLVQGVLGARHNQVSVTISDASDLVYEDMIETADPEPLFSSVQSVEIYGRDWTFQVDSNLKFREEASSNQPLLILVGGILIDLMLFVFLFLLSRANKQALSYADHATEELRVSARKLERSNHELERVANLDVLTNLPNRALLADRLGQAMLQCKRRNQSLAVAFLDLDGFKEINDSLGHDMGDKLLLAVSKHMKDALRVGDTLARIGGDEFVAVMVDFEKGGSIGQALERLLNAAAMPATIDGVLMQVSASIGVTLYPDDDLDQDQLLRHADQAMYVAKQEGKNRYHLFDSEQNSAIQSHWESVANVRKGLEQREFILHYQPKVNMATGEVIGVEALIRWQHPERGLIQPLDFLPVIEGHSSSIKLGEWVIESALSQIDKWKSAGIGLQVSVNISGYQLQQSNFASRLTELLKAHPNLNPRCLELEVLETSDLEDLERASATMRACHDLGISIALDDFGTGYSSLTHLRRLPTDSIKIDQSFVRDMLDDPDDLAIVKGVIGLAKVFNRKVVAEGVESVAHGAALVDLGCDLAQGFGIARPMPASEIPKWLSTWKLDDSWMPAATWQVARRG